MDFRPYICKCCGGAIDISTMKCSYCGTAYEDVSLKRIQITTVTPGQHTICAQVKIHREMLMNGREEALRDDTLRKLRNQIADGLLGYMKIISSQDPYHQAEIIRGEIRVLEPIFDAY